jgi:uncharacterized membrane protein YphA (DoxX/SURF4 family)
MPLTEDLAWLILRIGYAWLYLYALLGLLSNWQATKDLVALLFPRYTPVFAVIMVIVMFISAISIVLGFYAEIAGLMLSFYNLLGIRVHYKLAAQTRAFELSPNAALEDKQILAEAGTLGAVGHITSAQKNVVLFAVALFFMLAGSGPFSMTTSIWH